LRTLIASALLSVAAAFIIPAPEAQAGPGFLVCPSGVTGVATLQTSCAFADNVRTAYFSQDPPVVLAYSPVTRAAYFMYCVSGIRANFFDGSSRIAAKCYGGDNAEVVVW